MNKNKSREDKNEQKTQKRPNGGGEEDKNEQKTQKKPNGGGDIVGDFMEDIMEVMTPDLIERLKCVLTEDMGLSKKDADKFIQCQRDIRRQRICLKKDKRSVRIGPRNQWIKELSKDIADQMAMFTVGILLSNRTARTKRITEKVLDHLCKITGENTTVESAETRVERTMVVVADRMATWIDETISNIEKKMKDFEKYKSAASLETLSIISMATTKSTETESMTESEKDLYSDELSRLSELESKISSTVTSEIESELSSFDKSLTTGKETDESREESELESDENESVDEELDEEESDDESKESEAEESTAEDTEGDIETEEEVEEEEQEQVEEETEDEVDEESEDREQKDDEENRESIKSQEDPEQLSKVELTEDEEEPSQDEDILEQSSESSIRSDLLDVEIISEKQQKRLPSDILDLLKEDVTKISKEETQSDRHRAIKDIIDKRFEKIAKDKLDKSLNSLERYDIGDAASIVANWVETILSSADNLPELSKVPSERQGPAFEIKRGVGSQYQVYKLSSTTVAHKVAELRGLDPPIRKKKVPRTMSPLNIKSTKDWADWALDAANVGEEWGNWLDKTLFDVEKQLLGDRGSVSHVERYKVWKEWRDKKGREAQKWRVEEEKLKDEGALWKRKFQNEGNRRSEQETRTLNY